MKTTTNKERPIIFSAPVVNAILEGRKTQTRRIVKWEPRSSGLPRTHLHDFARAFVDPGLGGGQYLKVPFVHPDDGWESDPKNDTITRCYCPYGEVGDRLWVRETFGFVDAMSKNLIDSVIYKADDNSRNESMKGYWRSPIHMPRSASRITLEITGVRVERLQEISDDDCLAELGEFRSMSFPKLRKQAFRSLWQSINGVDSWAANPWVWVLKFRRVQK